ncbi:MAG: phospholipase D-like domain-containing protein, partial [Flavobacteriales bacterium]|nr:phospholipase D-like domain-containing protein [Flavobacteriales bacterium]
KRNTGAPSRLLVGPGISEKGLNFLGELLNVEKNDIIEGGPYHNMDDLFGLPNPIGKKLENRSQPNLAHPNLGNCNSIHDVIAQKDVLLTFPYQRYDYILRYFNEAALDPRVTKIKLTLYRVSNKSSIASPLISAAHNGKKVTVLVEAKARFDESNNLKWAKLMKQAGIKIVYSPLDIKVHSKIALIERQHEGKTQRIAFLGTGNFNENTANVYTDYALLTSDSKLCNELNKTFDFVFKQEAKPKLKELLVAQVNMPKKFLQLIDKEIQHANNGSEAYILLKLNNIQDPKMIQKLYEAAGLGVKVDIIIRGICCIKPIKNIRLIRVVDRYLEHSRVYYFGNDGSPKMYLGSADWMERNLYRRVEVAFPIKSEKVFEEIWKDLQFQLMDNVKGCTIGNNLQNTKLPSGGRKIRSQQSIYNYRKRLLNS